MNIDEKMQMQDSELFIRELLKKRNRGTEGCINTSEIARRMGLSTADLNSFLQDQGVLCRRHGMLIPTARYQSLNLAKVRSTFKFTAAGKVREILYPVWTPKGVAFLERELNIKIN
ncbi:MAG: phage antirepressor KilAC domain-containing protein [Prevotella sp.]|nr:phage antirepressor KilAC domain-containing protein [Prevotella sp.]